VAEVVVKGVRQTDGRKVQVAGADDPKKADGSDLLSNDLGAANGIATLDGSSLVIQNPANAQTTAAADKIPKADGSGNLAAGWGGAASSLATLNGSTKVVEDPANAQTTPAASKIPLADGSGNLAAGWGGAASSLATLDGSGEVVERLAYEGDASGVATLNGSSLVVENPANATATPTASKIPIADGSGNLAAGWGGAANSLATLDGSGEVVERLAYEGDASGVATLNGSSLVVENPANATATPTASKIPIADGSGNLAAGWGGAANTLATLNGSSKVVEDPASANTTPGSAVIPIADGSGNLAVGFMNPAVPRWTKITKAATDFTASAGTEDIEVFSLPAKGVIHEVVQKHTTAFSGGSLSALTTSIGISGSFTKYAATFDVFQATGDTVFQHTDSTGDMENFGSTTSIRIQAVATDDTLDNVNTGSVDVYILYSTLP
jgi:hypothetical protein